MTGLPPVFDSMEGALLTRLLLAFIRDDKQMTVEKVRALRILRKFAPHAADEVKAERLWELGEDA